MAAILLPRHLHCAALAACSGLCRTPAREERKCFCRDAGLPGHGTIWHSVLQHGASDRYVALLLRGLSVSSAVDSGRATHHGYTDSDHGPAQRHAVAALGVGAAG